MEIQEPQTKRYESIIVKFADETTLHGIRYVTNSRLHKARRLLWFILLISMAIWLVFGIMSGIRKYFTYPVSTVVEFNYVKTIDFPAVTFCNYNQFRRSKLETYDPVFQQILLALVVKQGVDIDWDYHDSLYNDNHWNMTEVAITSGHQLEDMLLSCTWNRGEACGPQNFTTTITDFGLVSNCYVYRGRKKNTPHPPTAFHEESACADNNSSVNRGKGSTILKGRDMALLSLWSTPM
ncbi:putative acid-sensing ion channel 1-like [Apostichopus japonicus]|uniref:Putative acid-sensing ion channel 1-like n=1 Tax=Stichopus japonicus TaxID=307972 RepID=A0A2G8KAU2_STIJA|nr:putative acid-sensing ion channel 1-like [Apostichopus japonicus]